MCQVLHILPESRFELFDNFNNEFIMFQSFSSFHNSDDCRFYFVSSVFINFCSRFVDVLSILSLNEIRQIFDKEEQLTCLAVTDKILTL